MNEISTNEQQDVRKVEPFEARSTPEIGPDERFDAAFRDLLTAVNGFPYAGDGASAIVWALRWMRANPDRAAVLAAVSAAAPDERAEECAAFSAAVEDEIIRLRARAEAAEAALAARPAPVVSREAVRKARAAANGPVNYIGDQVTARWVHKFLAALGITVADVEASA